MKIKVAQKDANRSTLRSSFFARIDLSIFQHARFQPAPDQTDQTWITDSMRDEPEHPIMTETPKEVLHIRLQHPSDFAAGNGLTEGRQGMMSAELWPATE